MNIQYGAHNGQNGAYGTSNGNRAKSIDQTESFQSVVEWLNQLIPSLNLPLDASEDELTSCLIDGTILCSILSKLIPASNAMGANSHSGQERVRGFLEALKEMGLPGFELSDLEQGNLRPILHCLKVLEAHFNFDDDEESFNHHPTRWDFSDANHSEKTVQAQGHVSVNGKLDQSDVKVLELLKSNRVENSSTQSLFGVVNKILDENIGKNNGDICQNVALVLRKALRVVEHRFSAQEDNLKKKNSFYKAREEKFQSRLRTLETLAMGTIGENEVVMNVLHQIKIDKSKLEEREKLEDVRKLKKEKELRDEEILMLKVELDLAKKAYENHCLDLVAQAEKTKVDVEKKIKNLECYLSESRAKVKELESFTESKYKRWQKKEHAYRGFIDYQCGVLQDLREAFESIKHEMLKTKRSYAEEFDFMGVKLKGLVEAAENYHRVLAENRRLYNEVQDLKGNIRVYCRVRPFLQGQSKKQTTIECIGENGELVVGNPLKPGKDSQKHFKFNKVFGPMTTQEEVFLDTRPLIRSVLDGYNVCIFAYGQSGSGKTYTMSGPSMATKDDWGVNYRALNDLFEISQNRKRSIMYEVGVQMVEIYNEQVRDLLLSDGSQKKLGVWNTAQPNGLAVPDASMHAVRSTSDVLELMNIGFMNRTVSSTALNHRSSRSHSVLTVHVRGTELKTGATLRGNLHLVDLAGSERVDRSGVSGDRIKEAQHINKSLSALGDVIFALAQKSQHVPYRNSKLTQVLQSSLGGHAKTLMFVQLNPDADSYSETVSTLKFSERVSGVELGAARTNKEGRDVRGLMDQVVSLKETIAKNEEEIERLHLKVQINTVKNSPRSLKNEYSSSPRRFSVGTPLLNKKLSRGAVSGRSDKAISVMDNCSEYSSDICSQQSVNELKHHKKSQSLPKIVVTKVSQNFINEETDLFRFGEADSDDRLSDISDGSFTMGGTETEWSMNSLVEFTLFPETAKPVKKNEKPVPKTDKSGKISAPTKNKKPPPNRLVKTKSSRSINKSPSEKVASSPRITVCGSPSATTLSKRWQ